MEISDVYLITGSGHQEAKLNGGMTIPCKKKHTPQKFNIAKMVVGRLFSSIFLF